MRVADSQIYNTMMYSMRKSLVDYYEISEKAATGKNINRPSDDPEGAGRITRYRGQISSMDQYADNINDAKAFLNQVDVSLGVVSDLLVSTKETALSAANATRSARERSIMADEVNALAAQINTLANADLGDQYLFSGYDTSTAPYNSNGVYQGDSGLLQIRINEFSTITLNFPGDEVFGTSGGGVDIFQVLTDLETALRGNDTAGIQTSIGDLDSAIDQVTLTRSRSGFRVNELANASQANEALSFEFVSMISEAEDADMSEVFMNFTRQEYVLQSVMATASRILQTNLLNFLQ